MVIALGGVNILFLIHFLPNFLAKGKQVVDELADSQSVFLTDCLYLLSELRMVLAVHEMG
jgi:hypothetical protein